MPKIFKFEFDPFDIAGVGKVPRGTDREAILEEVSNFVLESVLSDIGESVSPVTGRAFKKLNPEYAKAKKSQGSKPVANLELSGDMLDKLVVKGKGRGTSLSLFVSDPSQQGKVDGHNNFTGESKISTRKFIPDDDEQFRPKIMKGIRDIVRDALADDE